MTKLVGDWAKLAKRFDQLSMRADRIVPTIRKATRTGREIMQSIAPVDTGFMRDHIIDRDVADGSQIESEATYSGFPEYGTSRMAAQPFFRPPMTEMWIKLRSALVRILWK